MTIVKTYHTSEVALAVNYSEYKDGKWYDGILRKDSDAVKFMMIYGK